MTESNPLLLRTIIVRVYPPDRVPFVSLFSRESLGILVSKFNLTPVNTADNDGSEATLGAGRVEVDGRAIVIENLRINERRIILSVLADSHAARMVLERVCEQLAALDARSPSPFIPDQYLIDREESVLVQHLAFDWDVLVSEAVRRFVSDKLIPAVSDQAGLASVSGVRLSFDLSYQMESDTLAKAGVDISPKKFTVETRAGSVPTDRLYFTIVPADSTTHQSLLADLERVVKKSK